MQPDVETARLSVVVNRDWVFAVWRLTWYRWGTNGELLDDGLCEYSTDLYEAAQVEAIAASIITGCWSHDG